MPGVTEPVARGQAIHVDAVAFAQEGQKLVDLRSSRVANPDPDGPQHGDLEQYFQQIGCSGQSAAPRPWAGA